MKLAPYLRIRKASLLRSHVPCSSCDWWKIGHRTVSRDKDLILRHIRGRDNFIMTFDSCFTVDDHLPEAIHINSTGEVSSQTYNGELVVVKVQRVAERCSSCRSL